MWKVEVTNLFKNGAKFCELTATEARILDCFIKRPGQILSKELLAKEVGGSPDYIQNLMSKIVNSYSADPLPLETIKGKGWMWMEAESEVEK